MSLVDDVLDLFGWVPPARPRPKSSAPPKPAPVAEPQPSAAPAPNAAPSPGALAPRNAPTSKKASAPAKRAGRSEAEILAVVAPIAPHFRKVVFTRNRRIMASVGDRGRELRLNDAFATAPREVLAAVARLFSARDAQTRSRAKAAVREFIATIPLESTAVRRRPRTRQIEPGDEPHLQMLLDEFRRINASHFGGELPEVPLYLSGQMRRRNGHFCSNPVEIVISRTLCTHAHDGEALHTLRHEMIHLWQHATGKKPDHGPEFRAWARKLDVHPRATRRVAWKNQRRP
ncbi:SprT-like domain-containing protein [Longimicrobium sp.]|uniref:SprT-like domain-containing protein n=1 Tax=Longimicrobium sp. TaxID=2029185 RepID=UPI003B3B07B4